MDMEKLSADKPILKNEFRRYFLGALSSVGFAVNINTFVQAGGLYPGGFGGLTLLIQTSLSEFAGLDVPYTFINVTLNLIPVYIGFRFVGKKFTLSSCLVIILSSVLTDLIPAQPITYDHLLIAVFGGLVNGLGVSLCLIGNTSSGGTDIIAIAVSEKKHTDIWNYVLIGNAVMLLVAGFLFGWNVALYSIIFQFTSTQIIQMLHQRYKKHTLFIITEVPDIIYHEISEITHHSATMIPATGCYDHEKRTVLYSVVSREEAKLLVRKVREADPDAFVNVIKTDYINGRFYYKTDY